MCFLGEGGAWGAKWGYYLITFIIYYYLYYLEEKILIELQFQNNFKFCRHKIYYT